MIMSCIPMYLDNKMSEPSVGPKAPPSRKLHLLHFNVQKESSLLQSIVDSFPPKSFDQLDALLTKLKSNGGLSLINYELLQELTGKLSECIQEAANINFSQQTSPLVKSILKCIEPARLYLSIAGCVEIDKALFRDEAFENSMKFFKKCCVKLVLPGSIHKKKLARIITSLCSFMHNLQPLISYNLVRELWALSITDLLMKLIFLQIEPLQLAATETLCRIVSAYPEQYAPVIDEIILNLPSLSANPDQAIGAKSRKFICSMYHVSDKVSIHFSSYLILQLIQSNFSIEKGIKLEGDLNYSEIFENYHFALEMVNEFMTKIVTKC